MRKRKLALFMVMILAIFTLNGCITKVVEVEDAPVQETTNQEVTEVAKVAEGTKFNAGTYEAEATGMKGPVVAKVTVTADEIADLVVTAAEDTPNIGDVAAEQIAKEIVTTQSLAVDAISGATVTSNAAILAVTEALQKAGATAETLEFLKDPKNKTAQKSQALEDLNVDVVVIGAGGAGMSAAIEVNAAGHSVVILEQLPIVGGNTNRATGGLNAAETKIQEENNIQDTKEIFYQDTMKGGKDLNDPELLRTMVENAPGAIEWLNALGANISRVSFSGGQTNARIHTVADGSPIGPVIVRVLKNELDKQNVEILLNMTATEIIAEDGVVVGVVAEDKNGNTLKVNAKAVILATGGFGANSEMVELYREDLKGFFTTNHPGATGGGILMAQAVGADLTDIEQIQIHPTTDPKTGYLFTEGLRGEGAILVNNSGERFTNELLTRDVVSQNILNQPNGTAYLIVDEAMHGHNAALAGYISDGYAVSGDTIEDLAKAINVDPAVLANTLTEYNKAIEAGKDELFGRESLSVQLTTAPFYAIPVTPSIHHTMGGVKIDTSTHVIGLDGKPISGLYAAGEVTGGVHGGNRIGGNAVADIIVFGRIAGQTASSELK